MGVWNASLTFYRKTFKRFQPVHRITHGLMTRLVIPFLERVNNFQTIADDPFWFRFELLTNKHETETRIQLQKRVKSGMVVLDVGAHVGYYTRLCASLVGNTGQVIAFEPHPRTFQVLSKNVAQSENVQLFQVAVAESEGTAELYDYLMMSASGSLHYDESMVDLQKSQRKEQDVAPRLSNDFSMAKYTVKTVPIDDCLEQLDIQQVDVVKMDIEGAEIGALRGMQKTIQQSPNLALIMEYNPSALQSFDLNPRDALQEVMDMGFHRLQVIQEDGSLLDWTNTPDKIDNLTDELMSNMGVVNLLLTRQS